MAYFRKTDAQTLLILANFQNEERSVELPGRVSNVVLNNLADIDMTEKEVILRGYQAVVLEL